MQRSSRQKGREGGREGHVPIPGGNHKAFYLSLCEKGAEVAHIFGLSVGKREGGREREREGHAHKRTYWFPVATTMPSTSPSVRRVPK